MAWTLCIELLFTPAYALTTLGLMLVFESMVRLMDLILAECISHFNLWPAE